MPLQQWLQKSRFPAMSDLLLVILKTKEFYILNLEKLSVGDVETEPTHKGELQISDNFYQLDFPETTTRVAHMAKINRYTGKLNGEAGSPPFGKSKDGNWHRTGLCKKVENKKLF